MITWKICKKTLDELKEHPKNPRKMSSHDSKHLKESIKKFGVIDKIIVNIDGTIIGGHQRKHILESLGSKNIDCWVPDRELTEEEVDELNIRLNRNKGHFDFDILANEWDQNFLMDCGFKADDFLDTKKPEKEGKKKYQVILEFSSEDHLQECLIGVDGIEYASDRWNCKLKVK